MKLVPLQRIYSAKCSCPGDLVLWICAPRLQKHVFYNVIMLIVVGVAYCILSRFLNTVFGKGGSVSIIRKFSYSLGLL